jgi:hypothetical protein
MPDDNAIDTNSPHIGSPLAGLGPETIKSIALQSRPLTDSESTAIKKTFGDSINPSDIRIAFDNGASGTNLRGYVLGLHLPTVMFLASDSSKRELSENELHEATHIWQKLSKDQYTGKGVPAKTVDPNRPAQYSYDKDSGKPFTEFGPEQQAEMVQNNENSARAFVQSHKASRPFLRDMAFLDSVRSRYRRDAVRDNSNDPAILNSMFRSGNFTAVDWSGDAPKMKGGDILKPKISGSGDHNVVLENLRTKFPSYRGIPDGKVLAALLHRHPSYVAHVGDAGLRLALETGHKPNEPTE